MDPRDKYLDNLKQISILLKELEINLKEADYEPPYSFPELQDKQKIAFPRGYIRNVEYFKIEYGLSHYLKDPLIIKSICYSLQLLDVYSYFINRFDIGLSAGKMFLKLGMIHIFSIFEGMLFGACNVLNRNCYRMDNLCRKNANCAYYLKKSSNIKFNDLIDNLIDKDIIRITDSGRESISKFKELRDNIHLHLIRKNELDSGLYNLENYNKMVSFILHLKSLPQFINNFIEKRDQECIYRYRSNKFSL